MTKQESEFKKSLKITVKAKRFGLAARLIIGKAKTMMLNAQIKFVQAQRRRLVKNLELLHFEQEVVRLQNQK